MKRLKSILATGLLILAGMLALVVMVFIRHEWRLLRRHLPVD